MAIIGIVLGVLNAALPMQEINEFIFPLSLSVDEVVPVDYAEEGFLTVSFYNYWLLGLFQRKSSNRRESKGRLCK